MSRPNLIAIAVAGGIVVAAAIAFLVVSGYASHVLHAWRTFPVMHAAFKLVPLVVSGIGFLAVRFHKAWKAAGPEAHGGVPSC